MDMGVRSSSAVVGVEQTADGWSRYLGAALGVPVVVTFGRSRSVPVQSRRVRLEPGGGAGIEIRLHRMFAAAPGDVRQALARWLRLGRRAGRASVRLDGWIQEALVGEPPPPPRATRLVPSGEHHDLDALARPLFQRTFPSDFGARQPRPELTWGRRGRSRSRRSLRLGSFDVEARVVRVHPVLDRPDVPDWFVRFVLMHEILHAVFPPRPENGRWIHHGPEFRARERDYPDYGRALRWEQRNLPLLIQAARGRRVSAFVTEAGPAPPRPDAAGQLELFP